MRIGLAVVLLAGLGVRLGWVLAQADELDPGLGDQHEYLELGRNLLAGNGLSFYDPRFEDVVYAFRMPGYPAFVASCGGNLPAIRMVQAVIDVLTVLGVYLLGRRVLALGVQEPEVDEVGYGSSSRADFGGLVAAVFVAFNPLMVHFTTLVLTETLFIAMLVWAMVLLVYFRSFLWGGMVLALSVLVRPSGVGLPVALGVAGVLANCAMGGSYQARGRWVRWPLPVAATMLLLTLLVLLPWGFRNGQVLGEWVFGTTNEGITRYDGFHPDATGASDQQFVEHMPWLRTMSEIGRSQYLREQANDFIRANPWRAIELAVIKVGRTWSPVPLSAEYGSARNQVVLAAYAIPLYLLAMLGLWKWRGHWTVKLFLLMPALYFTVVHAASVGSIRYRVPAEAGLAVLAAAGVMVLGSRGRRRERAATMEAAGRDIEGN
jgi:4-amino-4-deoxy-L-arabinose transferase-like glycosyltransferase